MHLREISDLKQCFPLSAAKYASHSSNRVPASAGGKGGILTSVRWQVTLCDPIWHVSFS